MPTIDKLASAVVAADSDLLLVSQGGVSRRLTRAQLLAGTQAALSLDVGLLGRSGPGIGQPQQIRIAGGLQLRGGVLSCPPSFTASSLPKTTTLTLNDAVPVLVTGQDLTVPVSTLLSVPGADISGQLVESVSGLKRSLQAWANDEVSVHAFGAVGDGVTDDTPAFTAALLSGRPLRLDAKTYRVDGQWTVSAPATLRGVAGMTVMRRGKQVGGAWIDIAGTEFHATGITFDAGAVTEESWGVLVEPTCKTTSFQDCAFVSSIGGDLGNGLTIQARDGLEGPASQHVIRNCVFARNAVHGLWLQAASGGLVESCLASDNGAYGICLDFNDPTFSQTTSDCLVSGCRCSGNERGISVGNFNETNGEPPRWGLSNPDARRILVQGNVCAGNSAYGIAVSGESIRVSENLISTGASMESSSGILLNASRSAVSGNQIVGPGQFGIDAGGCVACDISGNLVSSFLVGINAGGGTDVQVVENRLHGNERAVTIFNVETDGNGRNFGLACDTLLISRNVIELLQPTDGGIYLFDGPSGVKIERNRFLAGPDVSDSQGVIYNTDHIELNGNSWNGLVSARVASTATPAGNAILFPDLYDHIFLSADAEAISCLASKSQVSMAGRVSFIRVTNAGSGYSRALVTISGRGTGAAASAYIRDGAILGVALISNGSGYDQGDTRIVITGDGVGATAAVVVGLPIPTQRRISVYCEGDTTFLRLGSEPLQENWLKQDLIVPAGTSVEWTETAGYWQASNFQSKNILQPTAGGDILVRSAEGEITLQPLATGRLRVCSNAEQTGFISCFGRGSPEGVIAAPPGSDYRNLDGGVGNTLWIKRLGSDNIGWTATA